MRIVMLNLFQHLLNVFCTDTGILNHTGSYAAAVQDDKKNRDRLYNFILGCNICYFRLRGRIL